MRSRVLIKDKNKLFLQFLKSDTAKLALNIAAYLMLLKVMMSVVKFQQSISAYEFHRFKATIINRSTQ